MEENNSPKSKALNIIIFNLKKKVLNHSHTLGLVMMLTIFVWS